MNPPGQKPRRGCLLYGGIAVGSMVLVICLAVFFGYRYARSVVDEFTDAEPAPLPEVRLSEPEMQRLRNRIEDFSRAVEEGRASESLSPLSITADEVNALLAADTNLSALKIRFYVSFESNRVPARVSIPAEELGLRPLRGRYLNGTGEFMVLLRDGTLHVGMESLSMKDKPLPETIMRHIRSQNFAQQWNDDPKVREALAKLKEVEVKDGRLLIVPK
jgi:hypothetical protein